jgi:hypothetical protein
MYATSLASRRLATGPDASRNLAPNFGDGTLASEVYEATRHPGARRKRHDRCRMPGDSRLRELGADRGRGARQHQGGDRRLPGSARRAGAPFDRAHGRGGRSRCLSCRSCASSSASRGGQSTHSAPLSTHDHSGTPSSTSCKPEDVVGRAAQEVLTVHHEVERSMRRADAFARAYRRKDAPGDASTHYAARKCRTA